jgi:glycosyltransferase involved in cell wall biosynthesis
MISVVVPVHNAHDSLIRCLQALLDSDYHDVEIVVVDDCSTDDSADIASRFPVRLMRLAGNPFGPGYARNRGAEIASGEIVCFIDSDVVVHSDTLGRIARTLERLPEYAGLFGSYDEHPGAGDFLSQYKNLVHHFVHQQSKQDAGTFWSGCGAMRRDIFLQMGGFDAKKYPRPSIEDIDLGCRMRRAGYKIYVDRDVQAAHLKKWTLKGWMKTDIFDRAIPWTRLIMSQRNLPNDLNLTNSQRLSALLVVSMLFFITIRISIVPLFTALLFTFLSFVLFSHSQVEEGSAPAKIDRMSATAIVLLVAGTAILSVVGKISGLLIPLGVLSLLCLANAIFSRPLSALRRYIFALYFLTVAGGYGILLASSSWIDVAVVFGTLISIVLLNFRLFNFFLRRRNAWFALTAVPFHLTYYLYSLFAFFVGVILYFRDTRLKGQSASLLTGSQ